MNAPARITTETGRPLTAEELAEMTGEDGLINGFTPEKYAEIFPTGVMRQDIADFIYNACRTGDFTLPGTPKNEQLGFIYFMLSPIMEQVKIGFAKNPEQRLRELQVGSADQLELILCHTGTINDEQELHRQFAAHRTNGEWFRFVSEIEAYVDEFAE